MLTVEQLKKMAPEIEELSDDELIKLRDKLYPIVQKLIDRYLEKDGKI